jgi:hypothetical protein
VNTGGQGYVTAHINDYVALLNGDANEIAIDQNYIKLQTDLKYCAAHQASFVRVYGYSGGDQPTALAVANKVISPILQNLGGQGFIFVNTNYDTATSDTSGYNYAIIDITWRF